VESAEALRLRSGAQNASLLTIAKTVGAGLEQVLRDMALWLGEDPSAVRVVPNTDFADDAIRAEEVLKLIQAKRAGAPISLESLHSILREYELTDLDFATEMARIAAEPAIGANGGQQ
jgi:hypothetical protein